MHIYKAFYLDILSTGLVAVLGCWFGSIRTNAC